MMTPTINNTLCLAKWLQVTIDLHHGVSKSCHHTKWTTIDTSKAIKNPDYLHNTDLKAIEREQMINGQKPNTCSFCWDHEKEVSPKTSDRFIKSFSDWAISGEKNNNFHLTNPTPSYVEVMFDKKCNLSCVYCSPDSSSTIESEIKEHGVYPIEVNEHRSSRLTPSKFKDELILSFFKWLPILLPKLHTLRVTGGEPLLSSYTSKLVGFIKEQSHPNLTFSINTNLIISKKKLDITIQDLNQLSKMIKQVELYTSIEAHGKSAEYIRSGLNYNLFMDNLKYALSISPEINFIIISTINKLSLSSYLLFLKDYVLLKKQHKNLNIDFVQLQEPSFLSIKYAEQNERDLFMKSASFIDKNKDCFTQEEIFKFSKLITILQAVPACKSINKNFNLFVNEYSKRNNKEAP